MKTIKMLFFFYTLLASAFLQAQSVSISYPMNRAVFQRCELGLGDSSASFYVAGQCLSIGEAYRVQMKITKLSVSDGSVRSVYQDWTTVALGLPAGGLFRKWINHLPGGWYRIEARALGVKSNLVKALADIKVGVGEVFLIAGQSNAQGVTTTPSYMQQPYDGVVADLHMEDCSPNIPAFPSFFPLQKDFPIATQGTTNWCYTVLGNKIADREGVPVVFFNAARYATTVGNWEESSRGEGTEFVYVKPRWICEERVGRTLAKGQPYLAFKNALTFYGSLFGLRGILWHQGETDNQQSTDTPTYIDKLQKVIAQSRKDFGNDKLKWFIAKASYNPEVLGPMRIDPTAPQVIAAQVTLSGMHNPGPNTDGIGVPRLDLMNQVHFGGDQLREVGEAWSNSPLTSGSSICPSVMPTLTFVQKEDGSYQLTAQEGFSEYYWVNGDNQLLPNNVISRERTLDHITTPNSYRYYAKTEQGTYVVSQKVYLPLPQEGARLGVDEEDISGVRLTISPNPLTDQSIIELVLSQEAPVRIELLTPQGQLLKVLADNYHVAGTYRYPIPVASLATGMYLCRVRASDWVVTKKFLKMVN